MEEQRQRQEEDARRVQTETMPTVPGECCVCVCACVHPHPCVCLHIIIFLFMSCATLESMEAPAGLAQAGLAELPYDPVSSIYISRLVDYIYLCDTA